STGQSGPRTSLPPVRPCRASRKTCPLGTQHRLLFPNFDNPPPDHISEMPTIRPSGLLPCGRLCGQVEYQSDATRVVSNQMRKCDRKRITEDSLRNVSALVKRPNGIKGVLGPDVHLAFADCRSCVDVRVEFIDRQNF